MATAIWLSENNELYLDVNNIGKILILIFSVKKF